MMATHSRAMMTVQRFRFFSAHKDKQGEQEAEDDKKNLQHKLDSSHSGHG